MKTPFDSYYSPNEQRQGQTGLRTPYTSFQQGQQESNYQTIPETSQATAGATRGGQLQKNRTDTYRSFIDQVVNAELPKDEQAARAGYIPTEQGSASYRGQSWTDSGIRNASAVIPSAMEYASLYHTPYDTGIDNLVWGGPNSGKNKLRDYLDQGQLQSRQGQAANALNRALIPDWLSEDASQNLRGKWEQQGMTDLTELAGQRAQRQGQWWDGSQWVNKSFIPEYEETIFPESRELIRPEQPFVAGRPAIEARDAWTEVLSPAVSYQPARTEQRLIANAEAARYEKGGTTGNNQYFTSLDNSLYPGMTRGFYLDPDGEGFSPNWSGPGTMAGSWTVDASMEELLYDRAIQQFKDYYTNNSPEYLYSNPTFNVSYQSGVDYGADWGFQATPELGGGYYNPQRIDYRFDVPVYTYDPSNPNAGNQLIQYFPAKQAQYESVLYPEVQARDAVTFQHPAQEYVPSVPEIPYSAAEYLTIPPVTYTHPEAPRPGFETIVDPLTGVAIPNWYLNGDPSNPALAQAYGAPDWYLR